MTDPEKKGMDLMQEAEKKLQGSKGLFGLFGGGESRTDDAIELFQRAANTFKMAKKWGKAGEAFVRAGELHLKGGSRHDAATNFVDGANCYKKTDVKEAVACLERAIEQYLEMGRFTLAAKHHQSIAETYEGSGEDLDKAIQHYEQAAEYYKGEESNAAANKCLLKVAQHAAEMEDYVKAIKVYEQVAGAALENPLLKYGAKEYFFRAALCHLCVDMLNATQALDRYGEMYPAFQDSREYKLIKMLTEHLEHEDVEAFTETVKDYDQISRLDQWYTTLLLRIKKTLSAGELC